MSCERAFITVLGRYVWAMVNSYYAVLREEEYFPDAVYIVSEERYRFKAQKGKRAFEILNQGYDVDCEVEVIVVEDVDFVSAGKRITEIINNLDSSEIALDITPGRKPLVTAALVPAIKQDLEHIYYLEVTDLKNMARPYLEIPLSKQTLWDFSKEVTR